MATFTLSAELERDSGERYALDGTHGYTTPAPGEIMVLPAEIPSRSAQTLTAAGSPKPALVEEEFGGATEHDGAATGGVDWFETFHVIPRSFDFGNLLSDQSVDLEVFSAFRRLAQEWTSFTNGAGDGVELDGDPTLPEDVDPLTGFAMTLEVSAAGEPFVDDTLDFVFEAPTGTISVPIEIQRIVLFGLEPELPFIMRLEFLTDVHASKDGTEKRAQLRTYPRQVFEYDYVIQEGLELQTLENLLFDFQSRTFGVPVWFDDANLSSDIAAGVTTIPVDSTAYRDFRVGGLAVLFTSQAVFDVLEITTVNASSLELAAPTLNAYTAGQKVYPLATCRATAQIQGSRYPVGLSTAAITFTPTSNAVDLGDLSPFGSYNGKLLLDENAMTGATKRHTFRRLLDQLDGGAGLIYQDSPWDRHKRSTRYVLRAEGRQAVSELIGLVHAIKGRKTSWYMARSSDDLVVVNDLLNASNTMDVTNVGYAQFVRNRQPKNVVRVTLNDGTEYVRTITDSAASSATVDQLTVDVNWPATIAVADIARVEYVEKVRFDSDAMRLEFDESGNRARLVAPVVAVFE